MLRIIRKTFLFIVLIGLVLVGLSGGQDKSLFTLDKNQVQASGGAAYQFAGRVTFYQPACAAVPPDGVCKNCMNCSSAVGNYVCGGYQEIQFMPFGGSMPPNYVCIPQGFPVKQSMPIMGGQVAGLGASNILIFDMAASP